MVDQRLTLVFERATPKQCQVLDLIGDNLTSKEIAHKLGISESAVNQRIEGLRTKAGGVPRNQLARAYREWARLPDCKNVTGKINQLPEMQIPQDMHFSDAATTSPALVFETRAPWQKTMLNGVPEVFDGRHGTLFRTAAIVAIALGILILALLGFALAIAISSLG